MKTTAPYNNCAVASTVRLADRSRAVCSILTIPRSVWRSDLHHAKQIEPVRCERLCCRVGNHVITPKAVSGRSAQAKSTVLPMCPTPMFSARYWIGSTVALYQREWNAREIRPSKNKDRNHMEQPSSSAARFQTGSVETVVRNEAHTSGVSWAAVVAGAFVAAALSLALLALGTGIGFSAVSPWANAAASVATIGWTAIALAGPDATHRRVCGGLSGGATAHQVGQYSYA